MGIQASVVDPNTKESVSFGRIRKRKKFGCVSEFRARYYCTKKCEKSQSRTLERDKNVPLHFSVGKLFPLSYRFQNTYESNERNHFKKFRVKILD
jgi:hypothetical protein